MMGIVETAQYLFECGEWVKVKVKIILKMYEHERKNITGYTEV